MRELRETLARVQTVIEHATRDAPETETAALMREVANRMEAFSLFECVGEILALPHGGSFYLDAVLARADAQGPYRSVFLKEGIGYLYAASELHRTAMPHRMIARARDSGVPAETLAPLHMGLGLCFAEHALRGARSRTLEAAVERYYSLWRANAGAAWQIVAGEPLGFATRTLIPAWTGAVARVAARLDPAAKSYYWHGVGRGLYFAPALAVPLCGAHGRALWLARADAPTAEALRNAIAGWAWGMTLTNLRHPDLIESALVHAGEAAPPLDALRDGIAGALALADVVAPRGPLRRTVCGHEPRQRHARRLWDRLVRPACAATASADALPSAFRYRG